MVDDEEEEGEGVVLSEQTAFVVVVAVKRLVLQLAEAKLLIREEVLAVVF